MNNMLADIAARQITNENDLIGKVIVSVCIDTYAPMIVQFTDGTWAQFSVDRGWDGEGGVKVSDSLPDIYELRSATLIDEMTYQFFLQANHAQVQAEREARERREYEIYKAKFG